MASMGTDNCTGDGCPVPNSFLLSAPSLAGSAVMLAAFGLLVPVNFFLAIRYRTALYSTAMIVGLVLEVVGYVGRLLLRENLASRAYFVIFLLGTVLGPSFISAALFIVLNHLLGMAPKHIGTMLQPSYTTLLFSSLDILYLVLQAAGSVFATRGNSKAEMIQGLNLLVAGLGIQIGSLVLFFVILSWILFRTPETSARHSEAHLNVFRSGHFKIFILCLHIAAAFILGRTIYRILEFVHGLDSILTQSQVLILVLDGVFILLASIILSIASPGRAFGPTWSSTTPFRRTSNVSESPGQYQESSYPYGYSHSLRQTPAHWQQPGYQQPKYANYTTAQQHTTSAGEYSPFERPVVAAPRSPPGSNRQTLPGLPHDHRAARRSGGAAKKKPSEKRDVVDPDALWG